MSQGSALGLAESDSEDELPSGWEERTTGDGRVYYANHLQRATQWTHPRTGRSKRLAGPLPHGWASERLSSGRTVFVNHEERKTSYTDPRLAFAQEDKAAEKPRQKFDASSKVAHVLHGLDLSGRVFALTGGTSGIGRALLEGLLRHKAHVVLFARSGASAARTAEELEGLGRVDVVECDLRSLASVRRAAAEFLSHSDWALHVLILNAAVMGQPFEELSESRVEATFGVNHLGHFYLAQLLTKRLIASAPSRVVVVSSESHRQATVLEPRLAKPQPPLDAFVCPSKDKYWYLHSYNASKLANVLFALELNRRLSRHKVTANAVHPGNLVWSRLHRHSCLLRAVYSLARPWVKSVAQAAASLAWAAVAPELYGVGGAYINNSWFCAPSDAALSEETQLSLWEHSEELVRDFERRFPAHQDDLVVPFAQRAP